MTSLSLWLPLTTGPAFLALISTLALEGWLIRLFSTCSAFGEG